MRCVLLGRTAAGDLAADDTTCARLYDGTSRQRIAAIDTLSTFGSQLTKPYGTGRLKISRDGKWLFANVDWALAMYRLDL